MIHGYRTQYDATVLFPTSYDKNHNEQLPLPERLDVQAGKIIHCDNKVRYLNSVKSLEVFEEILNGKRRKGRRGKASAITTQEHEALRKQVAKIQCSVDFRNWLRGVLAGQQLENNRYTQSVTYKSQGSWPGRRGHSPTTAASSLPQVVQTTVLQHTRDLDIVNECFNLGGQILDKVVLITPHPFSDITTTLQTLRDDRQGICETELRVPLSVGKPTLLNAFGGKKITPEVTGSEFLKKVSALARILALARPLITAR